MNKKDEITEIRQDINFILKKLGYKIEIEYSLSGKFYRRYMVDADDEGKRKYVKLKEIEDLKKDINNISDVLGLYCCSGDYNNGFLCNIKPTDRFSSVDDRINEIMNNLKSQLDDIKLRLCKLENPDLLREKIKPVKFRGLKEKDEKTK
jgi:hypothetical protein